MRPLDNSGARDTAHSTRQDDWREIERLAALAHRMGEHFGGTRRWHFPIGNSSQFEESGERITEIAKIRQFQSPDGNILETSTDAVRLHIGLCADGTLAVCEAQSNRSAAVLEQLTPDALRRIAVPSSPRLTTPLHDDIRLGYLAIRPERGARTRQNTDAIKGALLAGIVNGVDALLPPAPVPQARHGMMTASEMTRTHGSTAPAATVATPGVAPQGRSTPTGRIG